jgi:hypothetical protein
LGLSARHLARLRRELRDGTADASREEDREQERDDGRTERRQDDGPIDAREVLGELSLRFAHHDGKPGARRVGQGATPLEDVVARGAVLSEDDLRVDRISETADERLEPPCPDESNR